MAQHVCPFWVGYILASPLRRLLQNPDTILSPYVHTGMTVMDVGSAMGFFSIPMARMVGPSGSVICVDMQERMFRVLNKRARKAGVNDRITTRACTQDSLGLSGLEGTIDFALASAVVHEVPDPASFFAAIHAALKPGAKCLVAEPAGHVSLADLDKNLALAETAGFSVTDRPRVPRSRAALLEKPPTP